MRPVFLLAATVATLCAFAPALADTVLTLPRFEAVSLKGGGRVVMRQGPQQRVTILRGDPNVTRFDVERRSLEISACENRCPANYKLEVEIVTPDVNAIAIQGGGSIETQGNFARNSIALSVQGGGTINTESVDARQVAASVQGGGLIRTRAAASLAASVRGGGAIIYRGDPSVATSIQGGGSVRPADAR